SVRYALASHENGSNMPWMKFEDVIPEEGHRVDIVLDVKYAGLVKKKFEVVGIKRAKQVKTAYVKFKGLGHENLVSDEPSDNQDTEG
ncbi:MAG: hypothetical protein Q9174_006932, partial [Haloplaca sp. 1 TL-2023]